MTPQQHFRIRLVALTVIVALSMLPTCRTSRDEPPQSADVTAWHVDAGSPNVNRRYLDVGVRPWMYKDTFAR